MPTTSKPAQSRHDGSLPAEIAHTARDVVLLRSELIKLDCLAYAQKCLKPAIHKSIVAGLVSIGGLFALFGAAITVGVMLGHLGWGMLTVGAGVLVVGGGVALKPPRIPDPDEKMAEVDAKLLDSPPTRPKPNQADQLVRTPSSPGEAEHQQERVLTKAELEQQIEAKEQLLEAEVEDLTAEARAQIEHYTKLAMVMAGGIAAVVVIGLVAHALVRRRGAAPSGPRA